MLISFENDVNKVCSLEFKSGVEIMTHPFLKIFKVSFLGHPVYI